MASTFGGNRIATTAATHNLTPARGRAIARAINRATFVGMVQWVDLPENQNADEAAWLAGFSALSGLTTDEVHFVMDLVVSLAGGVYLP